MKNDMKIPLEAVRDKLSVYYGTEYPKKAFNILFQCWAIQDVRQGKHYQQFGGIVRKRGWLKIEDANSLVEYCIRGLKPFG